MSIPTNAERYQTKLSQHDLQWYARMVETIRTRPYDVTGTEAADAISNLLFHVNQLLKEQSSEARHARHA